MRPNIRARVSTVNPIGEKAFEIAFTDGMSAGTLTVNRDIAQRWIKDVKENSVARGKIMGGNIVVPSMKSLEGSIIEIVIEKDLK